MFMMVQELAAIEVTGVRPLSRGNDGGRSGPLRRGLGPGQEVAGRLNARLTRLLRAGGPGRNSGTFSNVKALEQLVERL